MVYCDLSTWCLCFVQEQHLYLLHDIETCSCIMAGSTTWWTRPWFIRSPLSPRHQIYDDPLIPETAQYAPLTAHESCLATTKLLLEHGARPFKDSAGPGVLSTTNTKYTFSEFFTELATDARHSSHGPTFWLDLVKIFLPYEKDNKDDVLRDLLVKLAQEAPDEGPKSTKEGAGVEANKSSGRAVVERAKLLISELAAPAGAACREAARMGKEKIIVACYDFGVNVLAEVDELGRNALHHAAIVGKVDMIKLLLSKGTEFKKCWGSLEPSNAGDITELEGFSSTSTGSAGSLFRGLDFTGAFDKGTASSNGASIFDKKPATSIFDKEPGPSLFDKKPGTTIFDQKPGTSIFDTGSSSSSSGSIFDKASSSSSGSIFDKESSSSSSGSVDHAKGSSGPGGVGLFAASLLKVADKNGDTALDLAAAAGQLDAVKILIGEDVDETTLKKAFQCAVKNMRGELAWNLSELHVERKVREERRMAGNSNLLPGFFTTNFEGAEEAALSGAERAELFRLRSVVGRLGLEGEEEVVG